MTDKERETRKLIAVPPKSFLYYQAESPFPYSYGLLQNTYGHQHQLLLEYRIFLRYSAVLYHTFQKYYGHYDIRCNQFDLLIHKYTFPLRQFYVFFHHMDEEYRQFPPLVFDHFYSFCRSTHGRNIIMNI